VFLITGPVQPGAFQWRSLPHFRHSDDRVKRTGFNGHRKQWKRLQGTPGRYIRGFPGMTTPLSLFITFSLLDQK
jgi:hypothetical protein